MSRSSVNNTAWHRDRGSSLSSSIPYREKSLQYFPDKPCWCKEKPKASRWISWSNENPGRRYYNCTRVRVGGCKFFEWADPEVLEFLNQHLIDLRNKVHWLKREKDHRVLAELHAYNALNQELLQKKAWTNDLIKRKDMPIKLLLKKDAKNSLAINELRVKQEKLEGQKFVMKCVLIVALFAMFVKLLS